MMLIVQIMKFHEYQSNIGYDHDVDLSIILH
jgi:hypothetical protein